MDSSNSMDMCVVWLVGLDLMYVFMLGLLGVMGVCFTVHPHSCII